MKTLEAKAEKYALSYIKNKFSDILSMQAKVAFIAIKNDYLAGYQEANRWRNVEDELPPIGQEVLCKNKDYKQVVICDGMQKDYRWLKAFFTHWRPIE